MSDKRRLLPAAAYPTRILLVPFLLCETRSKIIAEYALRKIDAPIGVSEYTLSKALPKELKTALPSIKTIESELNAPIQLDDDHGKK